MPLPSMLLALALAAAAPQAQGPAPAAPKGATVPSAPAAPERPQQKLEPVEHHRLVLGGEAGRYGEWAQTEIERFFAFQSTIRVGAVHGKKSDQWASVARVNLLGPGDEKTRPVLALVLQFDRKTHKPMAYYTVTGSEATYGFQIELPADQPIRLSAYAARAGKLLVKLHDRSFEIDLPFEVHGLSVVASGLDAVFEPFELLRKAP
jgi:hypothetical protein